MSMEEELTRLVAKQLGYQVSFIKGPLFPSKEDALTFVSLMAEEYGIYLHTAYQTLLSYADIGGHYIHNKGYQMTKEERDNDIRAFYKLQFPYWVIF